MFEDPSISPVMSDSEDQLPHQLLHHLSLTRLHQNSTMAAQCILAESFLYVDDGINVVAADSVEECNSKLQQVATDLALWYDNWTLIKHQEK